MTPGQTHPRRRGLNELMESVAAKLAERPDHLERGPDPAPGRAGQRHPVHADGAGLPSGQVRLRMRGPGSAAGHAGLPVGG